MAFFKGTSTDYQDFLNILKNLVKDDHVSACSIYNGGTNYAIGDTIMLSGGTKYHEPEIEVRGISSGDYVSNAVVSAGGSNYNVGDELYPAAGTYSVTPIIEVTSVSGGAVTGVQINNPGICSAQPSNPVSTTSDGSGTGCTLTLTFTSGTGIITAIHISDSGVYTSQASNPVSQNTSSGSGTGAKFELTYMDTAWETKIDYVAQEATGSSISAAGTGYTANDIVTVVGGTFTSATTVKIDSVSGGIPTAVSVNTAGNYSTTPSNPASTSGGTGSGLTLTMTWANSVEERKYLMLHNTTSDQYVGLLTLKETSPETAYVLQLTGFTGFNSLSTPWDEQPGAMLASGLHEDCYVPLSGGSSPTTIHYWINVKDLRIAAAFKVASVYPNFYIGGIDPFLTTDEYAYPQLILGCIDRKSPYTYGGVDYAGMNNPGVQMAESATYAGPGWLRLPDGSYKQVANWEVVGVPSKLETDDVVQISPCAGCDHQEPADPNGWYSYDQNWQDMFNVKTAIPSDQKALKRINDDFILIPCILNTEYVDERFYGTMIGIFCFNPDDAINAEDRIYEGTNVYRAFQNCDKSNRNYFFAIKED